MGKQDDLQDGLCECAAVGWKEGVLHNLREGATPNGEGTGWAGETPLVCAAGSEKKQGEDGSDPLGCVEALLAAGADPNLPQSKDGVTPLCAAVARGHGDRVGLLLQRGADPGLANQRSGETPLSLAKAGGHQQIVEALVSALGGPATALAHASAPLRRSDMGRTCHDSLVMQRVAGN